MPKYLEPLWLNLRVADVLDIAVIAVLIYLGLSWFRRRASYAVAAGVFAIAALYLTAQTLRMFLTLHAFQFGLTLILLALVVIFQQDLRRAFQRLVSWRRQRWASSSDKLPKEFTTLIEAADLLAEQRIGALMVVEGREPLDGHIRGGIPLDGKVSIPLLHSIFHPKTQGHDGAVIVRNGRVEAFGAHLPLSTNLNEVGRAGTRHTAALGLAEVTDALVLVVSEERGQVSVAHERRLHRLTNAAEATPHATTFWRRNFVQPRRWQIPQLVAGEPGLKILALAIACMLWFLLAFRIETVQRTVADVPIDFSHLPDDWSVTDVQPATATMTISGPQRDFDTFDPSVLRVQINLSQPEQGYQEVSIAEDQLNLPPNLSVRSVTTPEVSFYAFPVERVELPIRAITVGQTGVAHERVKIAAKPARVPVILRRGDIKDIAAIETEPINVQGLNASKQVKTRLKLPLHARLPENTSSEVNVSVTIAPE